MCPSRAGMDGRWGREVLMGGYNPVESGVCEQERPAADSPTVPGSHLSRKEVRKAVHCGKGRNARPRAESSGFCKRSVLQDVRG